MRHSKVKSCLDFIVGEHDWCLVVVALFVENSGSREPTNQSVERLIVGDESRQLKKGEVSLLGRMRGVVAQLVTVI
jgi:hypothetical protein